MATHRLRALLITRDQLIGMSTALINKIRGLAKTFGILVGPGKGGTFERRVRSTLPDDPVVAALFESLLAMLGTLRERQHDIARQLGRVARQSGVCRLLMTMPGVGPLTAVSFMTTIEDPHRFRRSQDVGAYLGLTPRRYQSGEVDINGRISKCRGSPHPQAVVRSGQRHAVADLAVARAKGLGCRRRPQVGLLEGARCSRPQAGGHPAPDVARRAQLRAGGEHRGLTPCLRELPPRQGAATVIS